jgi:protein SCO1
MTASPELAPEVGVRTPTSGARTRVVAVLVALGALLVTVGGLVAARSGGESTESGAWRGAVLGTSQPRPDFALTDTEGRPYDFAARTRGRLTLLFFGYTSCPDVCPIHMATLAGALGEAGMPSPTVVFVTTDPERDTPAHLRDWLDAFSRDFVGLRGTPQQIRAAEIAAQIIAYTPDDEAHVVYPFGVRREDWIADLPRLLDTWGRS